MIDIMTLAETIVKSNKSKNIDAIDIINMIYNITDYSNQSPTGKDDIDNKIRKYYK